MASSVEITLTNAADGKSFSGAAHRLGMGSSATFVNSGSTPAVAMSGIIPSGGTPLDVAALGTPAMKVNVKAGSAVVQSTSATGGCFTVNNPTATDIDIAASDPTNPRIDLILIRVLADGSGATTKAFVERMTGTAAASPSRPSIASPPANTHYFPLAQVRVEAAATTIVAGKVTKLNDVDGVWTAAVGGLVPVRNIAAASVLPNYQPFVTTEDQLSGVRFPAGAQFTGMMTRYFSGTPTTNVNGDLSAAFGVRTSAGFVATPFPNGLLAAFGQDSGATGTPIYLAKWTSSSSTSSTATFRIFDAAGSPVGSTTFPFSVFAVGY